MDSNAVVTLIMQVNCSNSEFSLTVETVSAILYKGEKSKTNSAKRSMERHK